MGGSIGSMLTDLASLRLQHVAGPVHATTAASSSPAESFAAQLDASFRARAERLGLELPPAPAATAGLPPASGDDVEAIWHRAQLQSSAVHGPGDALMQAVSDAADARWEQRRDRSGGHGLFDF